MITAEEARMLCEKAKARSKEVVLEVEMPALMKQIEEAAKAECSSVTVYKMSDDAKEVLMSLGYIVNFRSPRGYDDDSNYEITF